MEHSNSLQLSKNYNWGSSAPLDILNKQNGALQLTKLLLHQ